MPNQTNLIGAGLVAGPIGSGIGSKIGEKIAPYLQSNSFNNTSGPSKFMGYDDGQDNSTDMFGGIKQKFLDFISSGKLQDAAKFAADSLSNAISAGAPARVSKSALEGLEGFFADRLERERLMRMADQQDSGGLGNQFSQPLPGPVPRPPNIDTSFDAENKLSAEAKTRLSQEAARAPLTRSMK